MRELENIVERAVVLCRGDVIEEADLELGVRPTATPTVAASTPPRTAEELKQRKQQARDDAVLPLERSFALEALRRNEWNVTRAARDTGMLRPNFQALLRKLEISPARRRDLEASPADPPAGT